MLRDEQVQPTLPTATGDFTGQDPATMEQMFNPSRQEPPQGMPRGEKTMVAGNGDVPLPSRGDPQTTPDMPERRDPGAEVTGLVKPDDTRYKDPQNLLMGNVIMGGMLPWAQAAADVASGRVPPEKFDDARMEHGRRLAELADEHADFVSAAQKTVPFLEGLGMGVMKPASTVAGTMARGAAVAAPQGGARGYSSGPVDEPSGSSKRAVAAVGGAATDAAIGAAGAGVAVVGSKIGSLVSESRALKRTEAEATKLDAEARATSAKTEASKVTAANDAARAKSMDKAYVAENKTIQADYAKHTAMPKGGLSRTWEENRKYFASDPTHVYDQMVEKGIDLEGMSKVLNLPSSVIVSRLAGKEIAKDTPLFKEMMEAHKTMQSFKERGLTAAKAKTSTGPSKEEIDRIVKNETRIRQQMLDEDAPVGTGKFKQDSVPEGTTAPKLNQKPAGGTGKPYNPPKNADPRSRAKNDNAPPVGGGTPDPNKPKKPRKTWPKNPGRM